MKKIEYGGLLFERKERARAYRKRVFFDRFVWYLFAYSVTFFMGAVIVCCR